MLMVPKTDLPMRAGSGCRPGLLALSAFAASLLTPVVLPAEETVSPPTAIAGTLNTSEGISISFTASDATSSEGHDLQHRFDWGNGVTSAWGGATQIVSWATNGVYYIQAQARCAAEAVESVWSGTLFTTTVYRILGAGYPYDNTFVEDFDSSVSTNDLAPNNLDARTYWSVVVNDRECAARLVVADTNVWGGDARAYNAWDTPANRYLSVYKSRTNDTARLIARFRNVTTNALNAVCLFYDLKCGWMLYTNAARTASFKVSYSTNAVDWHDLGAAFAGSVANTNSSAETNWLSSADMGPAGLWVRDIGGCFELKSPLAPLKTGDCFYVKWEATGEATDANMNFGIDNLRVKGVDILGNAYPYTFGFSETFDQIGAGNAVPGTNEHTCWSVLVNGSQYAPVLTAADTNTWGGNTVGYNAWDTAGNRYLSIYKSQAGDTASLIARFWNATGAQQDVIRLRYDLKCGWTRYTNAGKTASFGLRYSTDLVTWYDMGDQFSAAVTDEFSPAATDWLSSAQMGAASLMISDIGGTFELPAALMPGDTFYIKWEASGGAGDENMNFGIDNIRLDKGMLGTVIIVR